MFQALILENDESIIFKLTEALRSMNFDCLVGRKETEGKQLLKENISSIGIILSSLDPNRLDGMKVSLQQWGIGYERPVLGLTDRYEYYQELVNGSMFPDGVSQVLYTNQDEMKMRDVIDQVFYEHNQRKGPRKKKVLIVEDDSTQAEFLALKLIKHGYEPFRSINGNEGHISLDLIKPDIILLDMNLPVMDGETFARLLKSDEQTRDIPIIAISADASSEKSQKAGCDFFLKKPLKFSQLETHIRELVGNDKKAS